jgi:hypothetical protein
MSSSRKFRRAAGKGRRSPTWTGVEEYEIVFTSMRASWQNGLPREMDDTIARLGTLVHDDPRAAVPELREWIEHHPEIPIFYNFLMIALTHLRDLEGARRVNEECLARHPDYLFARINQAEFCLGRDDLDGFLAVFDHKLSLRELYPRRRRFHVTEFMGFTLAVASYAIASGNREVAERHHELMRDIDPDSPLTHELANRLRPRPLPRRILEPLKPG